MRQACTGGKSGLNPSDRDIAVLKIPLDIGSPPFAVETVCQRAMILAA
ncbi:protein of unknown function [Hyphomicrobium sp. 1Nfss2.1]